MRTRRRAISWVAGAVLGAGAIVGAGASIAAGAQPAATPYYQLVQYPAAGFGGMDAQITGAKASIDMEMYELSDPTVEQDLVKAAGRGVRVRVLLDSDFNGKEVNTAAFTYLKSRGVEVKWAPAGYIFHIKAVSFDDKVSDISTANLVAKYYPSTRDAEIIDRNPAQVHAIEGTFTRDWQAGPAGAPAEQTVQAAGLVWSPNTGSGTAESALVKQIRAARTAIDFTSEELSDPAVYGALAADARAGVSCRVVMTSSSEWESAFAAISQAGCQIHLFPDSSSALYIHEKLILDDPGTAAESMLLGSQNASVTSLTRNRELGVILTHADGGAKAIAAASATFDADFSGASTWSDPAGSATPAPAPTTTSPPTSAASGCHPLSGAGNCYEPGEYCSDADHGLRGVAGDGDAILCEDNDGWRWEPSQR